MGDKRVVLYIQESRGRYGAHSGRDRTKLLGHLEIFWEFSVRGI